MSTVSSEKADQSECGNVTQAIFMRDMDEPQSLSLVAQEDPETDSFYEIFDENVENGWTNIRLNREVPKEDHVKKAKQVYESTYTARMQDITGKLQAKAKEVAGQAVETSEGYASAGLGYLAEKVGYYVTNDTTQNLVDRLKTQSPFLVELKAAFFKGHNNAVRDRNQKTAAQRLAINHSYQPCGGVQVASLEGEAVGSIAGKIDLAEDNQNEGSMDDVPLGDDDDDEEDAEWDQLE